MKNNKKPEGRWIQLELIEYKPSIEELRQEIKDIQESYEKVRKRLFARQNYIEHKNLLLEKELEFLKVSICKTI